MKPPTISELQEGLMNVANRFGMDYLVLLNHLEDLTPIEVLALHNSLTNQIYGAVHFFSDRYDEESGEWSR